MSESLRDPVERLSSAVATVARRMAGNDELSPALDPSPRPEMGDYSTNAAMMLAGPLGRPPREIAAELAASIEAELGAALEKTEIAGPGFINLFLGNAWYRQATADMAGTGGATVPPVGDPERIIVEFVSANPTGPLTAASGRHAAYGDALSRLLAESGHQVTTEYYVNDGGTQVENFAASIAARMNGEEPPEDGYQGTYVNELAERARAEGHEADDLERLAVTGVEWMVEGIRGSLENFGVRMDDFFSERSLYEDNLVDRGIARLRAAGHVFEEDGAVWLRTTDFGDDKDRVLIRSTGEVTYFGADVAYHVDKIERGNDRLIDVLGADHHGYVARMAAAIQSLEGDKAEFEAQIMQLIHLVEGGQRTKMSKRAGDIVTLDELTADIGWTPRGGSCSSAATTARSTLISTWPEASHPTIPSTTSSTPTPGSGAFSERRPTRVPAGEIRLPRRSTLPRNCWWPSCSPSRQKFTRRRPSAHLTGSALMRLTSRPHSTRSTGTARSWEPRATESRLPGFSSATSPGPPSGAPSVCSGSPLRTPCNRLPGQRSKRAMSWSSRSSSSRLGPDSAWSSSGPGRRRRQATIAQMTPIAARPKPITGTA